MKATFCIISAITSFLAITLAGPAYSEEAELISAGRELISKHCSRCHAVATDDVSKHPQAPAFRTLGKRYSVESLEEALAEGIFTGHPDMPEFQFQPPEIAAVIAYLRSIQQK